MGSRKNRRKRTDFFSDHYWQSDDYNFRAYQKNFDMLLTLAINRFRWVGLPKTCDARYLEKILLRNGVATMSHRQGMPDVLTTLQAMPNGEYNMYGLPTKWRAVGYDGLTDYECDESNGVLCWYSFSRVSPWNAIEIFARKLAHYERTEDVNLTQQMTPFIGIAPQEKKLELVNLLKQAQGGEPAILGGNDLQKLVDNVSVLDLGVEMKSEALAQGYQNTLNNALMFLGVPHLAFEKGERMIEDEARANTSPTEVMLLDCLQARREFCEKVNEKWGLNVQCYYNKDNESLNYNYAGNIEAQAQDGILETVETLDVTNRVLPNGRLLPRAPKAPNEGGER